MTTNKCNIIFIQILLIHYSLKGGEIHTHTYTQKTMLILNMFIYQKKIMKKIKNNSRYHCCSNV
jgi:hypothetical protein